MEGDAEAAKFATVVRVAGHVLLVLDGILSCCVRPHASRITMYALETDITLEKRNVTMSNGRPG